MARVMSLRMIATCIVVMPSIISGCGQSEAVQRVSVDQAEKLVAAWVKTHRDWHYWHDNPKLKEVTTNDVWDRLHAQVFKQSDYAQSIGEIESYLIKDGTVHPMGVGLGGWGLMETCVCDVDRDSHDDLVYVYSWGSGMHRSLVEAYRFGGSSPTKIPTSFAVTCADVSLKKRDQHMVDLYATSVPHGKPQLRLGELTLACQNGKQSLDVKPDPKLPKEWEDRIWRLPASAK